VLGLLRRAVGHPARKRCGGSALIRYPGYATPWLSGRLSPDGSHYAFELDRGDGVRRIAIANLLDGSVKWLRTDDTNTSETQPIWSPSGGRIAFVRGIGSTSASIWVIDADGSGVRRLLSLDEGSSVYMHQWTPDGRYVA